MDNNYWIKRLDEIRQSWLVRNAVVVSLFVGKRGFLDVFSILYPRIQEVVFRDDVLKLEIPAYIVMGKYEARGRETLAREWFELLEAPTKELIEFDNSGHRPHF